MTFEEALTELGLESIPDARSARRAYLRAVKAHPPERDPEGFVRVRAAYECITDDLSYLAAIGEALPTPGVPPTSAEPSPTSAEPPPVSAEPPAIEPPAALDEASLVQEEIERIVSQLETGSSEALDACRKLVREHPISAPARWLLVDQLDDSLRRQAADKAVLDGCRAGVDGFRIAALARCPRHLTDEEMAEAAADEDPYVRAASAQAYLARNQPVRAGKLLAPSLQAASRGEGPPPDVQSAVVALAGLIAAEKPEAAGALQRALVAFIADAAGGAALGSAAGRWLLLSELTALESRLDRELYLALAAALSAPDIDPLHADVVDFCTFQPARANSMRHLMKQVSPNLHRVFHGALTPVRERRRARIPKYLAWRVGAIMAVVALNLAGVFSPWDDPDDTGPSATAITTLVGLSVMDRQRDPQLRTLASGLETALDLGDCRTARSRLRQLQMAAGDRFATAMDDARDRTRERCRQLVVTDGGGEPLIP